MPNKIILVVDDEPSVAGLIKHRLELLGYQVVVAETGQSAINVIRTVAAKQELPLLGVLLDLTLGDMSGLDVLRQIKEIRPSLPVIMVTGSHNETDAIEVMNLGALDYITKPIDFNYLANILAMQAR